MRRQRREWASMADGYPQGSIIVCPDCFRPVFALERGLSLGDRGGRAASAFRPLTRVDLEALIMRSEIHVRQRELWKAWSATSDCDRVLLADRPKAGDPCICPNCGGTWVKVEEREYGSAVDRGYRLELLHIPPIGLSEWFTTPKWRDDTLDDVDVIKGRTLPA